MTFGTLTSEVSYFILMMFITVGSVVEYFNVLKFNRDTKKNFVTSYKVLGMIIGICTFSLSVLIVKGGLPSRFLVILPMLLFAFFILELFTKSPNPFLNIGLNLGGVIYICLPMFLLNYIAFANGIYDGVRIMGIFVLIWVYDAGAYISGRTFGKTPLFERISPKKTVEGMFGGAALSIGVAIGYFFLVENGTNWVLIAIPVIIFGTLGDLIQSMLKRSLNLKDTGTLMPGHGGFLDRFDGFFFSIPFVAAVLILFDRVVFCC